MNDIYLNFTDVIKKIGGVNPAYAIGGLFAAGIAFYIILFVTGFFCKDMRRSFRHALFVFTNITALAAAVYCLAESLYYSKYFNLLSSLLTVCIFYALSILKVVFYPLSFDVKKVKRSIKSFKKRAFCSAPSEPYPPMPEEEMIKIFDRIASKFGAGLPELNNLPEITKALENKEVSVQDRHELFLLQRLAAKLKAAACVSKEEFAELGERLGALLKMLSKYQAEL